MNKKNVGKPCPTHQILHVVKAWGAGKAPLANVFTKEIFDFAAIPDWFVEPRSYLTGCAAATPVRYERGSSEDSQYFDSGEKYNWAEVPV